MRIGTRTLLFGVHQVFLHPILLAISWTMLFGFPTKLALWACFVVHDWGYWSKPNLDGEEGERHPELGSRIITRLFGEEWGKFCLYHSRRYAERDGQPISDLCKADKLAFIIHPTWLYVIQTSLAGEINEYHREARITGKNPPSTRYKFIEWSKAKTNTWLANIILTTHAVNNSHDEEVIKRWFRIGL